MKTITINAYHFDELSTKAKTKAMDTYYSNYFDETWYHFIEMEASVYHLSLDGFQIDRGICDMSFTVDAEETAKAIIAHEIGVLMTHAKEWQEQVNDLFNSYKDYGSYIDWLNENGITEDDYDFEEWVIDESGYQDDKESTDFDFLKQLEYEFLGWLTSSYEDICSEEYISDFYTDNDFYFDINGNVISYE